MKQTLACFGGLAFATTVPLAEMAYLRRSAAFGGCITAPKLCSVLCICPNTGNEFFRIGLVRRNWGLVFPARLRYHVVMPADSIDSLARRLAEALPEGLRAVRDDLEQNFRSILDSGLSRLDLVTREEFEVQQAVLARTRQKLEALEGRVGSLEASRGLGATAGRSAAKDETSGSNHGES